MCVCLSVCVCVCVCVFVCVSRPGESRWDSPGPCGAPGGCRPEAPAQGAVLIRACLHDTPSLSLVPSALTGPGDKPGREEGGGESYITELSE